MLQRERGSIIIYALLIMVGMVSIATTLVSVFAPKLKLVGQVGFSSLAIYAADTATEACLYEARQQPGSAIARPILTNGATIAIASLSTVTVDVSNDCRPLGSKRFKIRTSGSYQGVSRAFEITQ